MKKKGFDCVAMKQRIQKRQRKLLQGLTPTEESQFIQNEILRDPVLREFWTACRRTPVVAPLEPLERNTAGHG